MKAYIERISAFTAKHVSVKAGDFTGTYKMKNDDAAGEALIQQTGNDRIKFYINVTYRMNTGELSGEVPLSGNAATYVDKEFDCTVTFDFARKSLVLSQNGSCGMGLNVDAGGTYKRVSSATPKFPGLGNQLSFPTSVGSLAMLLAMRLASSTVSYGF
jgi:hypothetical protein